MQTEHIMQFKTIWATHTHTSVEKEKWRLSKYVNINRIKIDLIWFNLAKPNNEIG